MSTQDASIEWVNLGSIPAPLLSGCVNLGYSSPSLSPVSWALKWVSMVAPGFGVLVRIKPDEVHNAHSRCSVEWQFLSCFGLFCGGRHFGVDPGPQISPSKTQVNGTFIQAQLFKQHSVATGATLLNRTPSSQKHQMPPLEDCLEASQFSLVLIFTRKAT